MIVNGIVELLASASPPGAPGGTGGPRELLQLLGPMVIFGVVFYFALIRPQRLRTKQLEELVKSLKVRDKVLTSGGIVGIVVGVSEKTITIRSADTKLEIMRSAVSEVTERAGVEAAEAKS